MNSSNRSLKYFSLFPFNKANVNPYKLIFIYLLGINYIVSQNNYTTHQKTEKVIQDIGNVGQFVPAAASIVTIIIHNDKEGGIQFLKASAVNLAVTYSLKYVINKHRPEGKTDGLAFPSGHTSGAFQGASFLQKRYGWSYGVPAYVVAGFVAYSRLEGIDERHDMWDVLGGIIVGIGSTYLFTKPYQKEHLDLSFNSENRNYLVGLNFKF